jgi:hypothetical protein
MKNLLTSLCILITLLCIGPGAPSTVLASGACYGITWIPAKQAACQCNGFTLGACNSTSTSVSQGHYVCTTSGNFDHCINVGQDRGGLFKCDQSYNWRVILTCSLGAVGCAAACLAAETGIGLAACLACVAAISPACQGCAILSCDLNPIAIGQNVQPVAIDYGGSCTLLTAL